MSTPLLLPDTRTKNTKNVQRHKGLNWVPIFCANCGKDGGWVPDNSTFAFYLCTPCAEAHGKIDGTYMVPDEVFFEKAKQAHLEEYGRELSAPEVVEALKDGDSVISKLARDIKK